MASSIRATRCSAIFGLIVALVMTAFAILFGTRHTDATEHQDGLMLAIATKSIVKLAAFLTVGAFVVFLMFGGPSDLLAKAQEIKLKVNPFSEFGLTSTFITMTLLWFFRDHSLAAPVSCQRGRELRRT